MTHRQILVVLGGLMTSMLLAELDRSIVGVALVVVFFLKEIPLRGRALVGHLLTGY